MMTSHTYVQCYQNTLFVQSCALISHEMTLAVIFLFQKLMNVLRVLTIAVKSVITVMDHTHAPVTKGTNWPRMGVLA